MPLSNSKDRALRERAAAVIPNGMYGHETVRLLPDNFPQYFARAEGSYLWDPDGNRYIDFMCAYGPNLLGYCNRTIDAAAARQQALGDAMTGPAPVMVELAEAFVGMISHASWAMFAKNGTDVTTMAATVARAHTGNRKILVAKGAYHGAAPWCTPLPAGIIPEDRAHVITYDYNNSESLQAAAQIAGDDLAGIFASPFKHDAFVDQALPDPEYARQARRICDTRGALLIVDDVRAGFRLTRDCSWSLVGVDPDLSCWGKSFANGYPISALLGTERCRAAAGSIYVTGSFWFAAVAMAAAVATLEQIRVSDYLERQIARGNQLRTGLAARAKASGFSVRQTGPSQMPLVLFDDDSDFRVGFAWSAEMVNRGVYVHPWHNMFMCSELTSADIDVALDAAEEAFDTVKRHQSSLTPHPALLEMLKARH